MASEQVQAVEWTCDGCGKRTVMCGFEGEPDGFHGSVHVVGSWGGSPVAQWWACSSKCIRRAVTSALEREEARD